MFQLGNRILEKLSRMRRQQNSPPEEAPWAIVNETSTGIAVLCPHCEEHQPQFGGLSIFAGKTPHATHTCVSCDRSFRT